MAKGQGRDDSPRNYCGTEVEDDDRDLEESVKVITRNMSEFKLVPVEVVEVHGRDTGIRKVDPVKAVRAYRIIRAVSPFEFYAIYEEDNHSPFFRAHMNAEFQDYYNFKESVTFTYHVYVELFKCYAFRDRRLGAWMRVKVLSHLQKDRDLALVLFLDSGDCEYVPVQGFRELTEKFARHINPVFRCHLYDVVSKNENHCWHYNITSFFRELVQDKVFMGLAMSWGEARPAHESSSQSAFFNLGLVLVDKSKEICVSVNWLLVEKGLARSIGPGASSPDMFYLPNKYPLYEFVKSSTNYSKSGLSFRMDDGGSTKTEFDLSSFSGVDGYMPLFARNRMGVVHIAFAPSPDIVFVNMHAKISELKAMQRAMERETAEEDFVDDVEELFVGLPVACLLRDGVGLKKPQWCRAVIADMIRKAPDIIVILVDYGNVLTVPLHAICPLMSKFCEIPSFAIRLHMGALRPTTDETHWNSEVSKKFSSYVASGFDSRGQPLVFAYLVGDVDQHISLTEALQPLKYNPEEMKWVAEEDTKSGIITSEIIRNHPMLQSHFCSISADIMKERNQLNEQDETQFDFTYLSDFLVRRQMAFLIEPRVDKKVFYGILKMSYDRYYK